MCIIFNERELTYLFGIQTSFIRKMFVDLWNIMSNMESMLSKLLQCVNHISLVSNATLSKQRTWK